MKLLLAFILVLTPACAAQPPAAPARAPEDPALTAKLEELDKKATDIADLKAEFEQRKYTPMLKQPLTSSGTIKVKGATVRWDTVHPEPSTMRIDDKELRIYYPNQRIVEVYPIGEEVRRMTSSPLPRLAMIRAEFSIAKANPKDLDPDADPDKTIALELTPLKDKLKEHVTVVRVLLDVASGYALRVEITDPDKERTLLIFKNAKVNTGVKDSELELKVPEGVKVVHPLEGIAPTSGSKP